MPSASNSGSCCTSSHTSTHSRDCGAPPAAAAAAGDSRSGVSVAVARNGSNASYGKSLNRIETSRMCCAPGPLNLQQLLPHRACTKNLKTLIKTKKPQTLTCGICRPTAAEVHVVAAVDGEAVDHPMTHLRPGAAAAAAVVAPTPASTGPRSPSLV